MRWDRALVHLALEDVVDDVTPLRVFRTECMVAHVLAVFTRYDRLSVRAEGADRRFDDEAHSQFPDTDRLY